MSRDTNTQLLGKDTRHSERLSEGMESAAPGDLPWSDVNQDEAELQQQLAHLKPKHAVRRADEETFDI